MNRLFKYLSIAAMAAGALWFFVSCESTVSGDKCNGERMQPGDVCMSSRGSSTTYEQAMDAKRRGPQDMQTGGALLALGLIVYLTTAVIALRREPTPPTP